MNSRGEMVVSHFLRPLPDGTCSSRLDAAGGVIARSPGETRSSMDEILGDPILEDLILSRLWRVLPVVSDQVRRKTRGGLIRLVFCGKGGNRTLVHD